MANKMELIDRQESGNGESAEHFPVNTFSHHSFQTSSSSSLIGQVLLPSLQSTYLLPPGGVVCRLRFVERPLLVSIIINPLTKMVPNVKAPGGIRWTLTQSPNTLGSWDAERKA